MTRQEQLAFCQKCTKREFSPKQGLVCSLTSEKATFQGECPDFEIDQQEERNLKMVEENRKAEEGSSLSGTIIGGVLMIIGAIVWFVVGIAALDRIFFYPPVLLVLGIISIVKGVNKQNEERKRRRIDNTVLDGDL